MTPHDPPVTAGASGHRAGVEPSTPTTDAPPARVDRPVLTSHPDGPGRWIAFGLLACLVVLGFGCWVAYGWMRGAM